MSTPSPARILEFQAAALIDADGSSGLVSALERLLAPMVALPARLYLLDGQAGAFYSAAGIGCATDAPDLPVPRSVGDWPAHHHLLRCHDRIIGVLQVAAGASAGIAQLCAVLGPALIARHRHDELVEEQAQLNEMLACLTSAGELLRHLELDTLLVKVLETVMQSVRAQVGALFTVVDDRLVPHVSWGLRDEHVTALRYRTGITVQDEVLASGEAACLSAADIAAKLDLHALHASLTGLLALPLATGGRRQGVVVLGNPERPFGPGEQRLAQTVCGMAAIAIDNALLVRQALDRERLQKELDLARTVQEGMYPTTGLVVGRVRVAGAARPCNETGGDYFTYVERGGRVLPMIGDVSGHGLGAALYTTTAHAILHQQLRAQAGLEACFLTLNESLFHSHSGRFMTAAMVEVDPSTLAFSYVSAGHNPLLWVHAGAPVWLESCGLPLGILQETTFPPPAAQTLAEGDLLVLYTDGITEAANVAGEFFGDERLATLAIEAAGLRLSPEEVVARIYAALDAFAVGTEYADDLTLVVLTAEPPPAA